MKAIVELKNSISTDTVNEDIYSFEDKAAPLVANNGIHKIGGITNIQETEIVFPETGSHFYQDDGKVIAIVDNLDGTATVKVDGQNVGLISSYGVEKRREFKGFDDVALTADGTIITCKLNTNVVTISEWSFDGILLHTRNITFTNAGALAQYFTSLSFVRYAAMHYVDSQEFALRLGEQVVILQESDPTAPISRILSNTSVLGAADIRAVIVYNGILVVGGAAGRVGSFDGSNWRNYDGTGIGVGPSNSGAVIGGSQINAMVVYNNHLIVAGASGRLGSFGNSGWKNYDGSGSGGLYSDNGTLIGSNNILCMAVWKNWVAVAGVGGRMGSFDITNTKFIYTASGSYTGTTYAYMSDNTNIVLAQDINALLSDNINLYICGGNGYVATYDGAFVNYIGSKIMTNMLAKTGIANAIGWGAIAYGAGLYVAVAKTSTTSCVMTSPDGNTWTARAGISATAGWYSVAYGNGLFVAVSPQNTTACVMTSPDGITWTARSGIAIAGGYGAVTYGNGLFVAVNRGTTTGVMTSPDGITWTARTGIATTGFWSSVVYGGGVFVAVAQNATTSCVMTSPDGITWTARTGVAQSVGWSSVTYGNGLFVSVNFANATTSCVMTSPDGITWTARTGVSTTNGWGGVTYGDGRFVAVAVNTTTSCVMWSNDGITWTTKTGIATTVGWVGIAYANGLFVAVAQNTTTSCVQVLRDNYHNIFNTSTVVSTDNILAITSYGSTIVFGGSAGKIGSWDGSNWKNYNGTGTGTGIYGNGVAVQTQPITTLLQLGAWLIVGSSSGRVGSWDGSAWKDSDGTGTGTGPYSASALGGAFIWASALYSGNMIIVGSISSVNTIGATGTIGQFYTISLSPQANLLTGMAGASYLYVYRYENGIYLISLVNNSLNKFYILDNATKIGTANFGRYCWPQIKNGLTRHIVSETPRISTTNLRVFSTIGYTDFVTFVAAQVYVDDASSPVTIRNSQIGWNYADAVFSPATATNFFSYYGPPPVKTGSAFYNVFQTNTNTMISGNSKLTNGMDVPASVPFEIRASIISAGGNPGEQSYLSAAILDGGAPDTLGVTLTGVGEFDPTYQPQIVGDNKILYFFGGAWVVIKIGTAVTNRIQKITSRLYKFNTLSPYNVWDSLNNTLELGSMDYNGKMLFSSTAAPTTSSKVASVIAGNFSNSVDTGDKLVQIPTPGPSSLQVFGYRIPLTTSILSNYKVDTFVDDLYSFSTYSDGSELVLTDPANPIYASDTRVPVPIGVEYFAGAVVNGTVTVFLSKDYDGYEIGNDTPGAYIPFQLFGQTYLFDGLTIYQANFDGQLLSSLDKLCDAFGMMYIASSPTEIYFVSSFDNSLYTFTGGRNLSKSKAFTTLDRISKGVFSTIDNTLLLDGTDHLIWARDGIVTQNTKKPTQTALKFYSTSKGIIVSNDVDSWQYTYYTQAGSVPVPLSFQTAYFGQQSNQLSILKKFVVTIYNERRDVVHLFVTEKSKDQDAQYENTVAMVINAADWDARGYAHMRLQPKYQRSLGSSLQIDMTEKATVLDVAIEWEDSNNAAIAAGKSR